MHDGSASGSAILVDTLHTVDCPLLDLLVFFDVGLSDAKGGEEDALESSAFVLHRRYAKPLRVFWNKDKDRCAL